MRAPARSAATLLSLLVGLAAPLWPAAAPAAEPSATLGSAGRSADARTAPPSLDRPPPGFARTAREMSELAGRVAKVRAARAGRRETYARPYVKGRPADRRWQVSFFAPRAGPEPNEEIAQVLLDDRTGRVTEAWTGDQVAWTMARGYPGAFGRAVNDPIVWIGLSVLFVLPFLRRPLRLLHLDLAVLLAFSFSYALFGRAEIGASVPTAYPLLLYLLVRCLGVAVARSRGRTAETRPPLALAVPYGFLALAVVFLVGFRVGLNLTNSNVIDVGYSGVIGGDRLLDGSGLYGRFPPDNARGDTYGPVTYYAYVPIVAALGWSGRWDDLPAAHGAAIAFDLLALALLFLVGRRVRGPALGLLLAYLWASYPFTLLVANSNANDSLVAVLLLVALLVVARPAARGAALAAAGLSKFAPLALGPLLATYRGGHRAGEWASRGSLVRPALITTGVFAVAATVLALPAVSGTDLGVVVDRTLGFQNERGSPFSIWGLYDLPALQDAVKIAAVVLAVVVAFVPRRRDIVVLAALGAAVLIALQLGVSHWFYLYLVWFLPFLWIAVLGSHAEPDLALRGDGSRPAGLARAPAVDDVTRP